MKYTESKRTYTCCGKHYVTTLKTGKCYCTTCGKELTTPLRVPRIIIVTTK